MLWNRTVIYDSEKALTINVSLLTGALGQKIQVAIQGKYNSQVTV